MSVDKVDDFEDVVRSDLVVFRCVEEAEGKADDGVAGDESGALGIDEVDDSDDVIGDDVPVRLVVGPAANIAFLAGREVVPGEGAAGGEFDGDVVAVAA